MISIRSAHLHVELDDPGDHQRLPRWSRAGFVRQVVLDGRHAFCGVEDARGTGGAGLCQEFNMVLAPPGFAACPVGGWFLKPGVGQLRRTGGEDYFFLRPYPWVMTPMTVEAAADRVRFAIDHPPASGAALRLEQEVRAEERTLTATCTARNRGATAITLQEYRHDFLAPAGHGPGHGRRLRFDHPLLPTPGLAIAGLAADGLAIDLVPPPPGRSNTWVGADLQAPAPSAWTLEDPLTGLGLHMRTDRAWNRFALFTTAEQFSPEAFLTLPLAPGASLTWTRTWTFSGPA